MLSGYITVEHTPLYLYRLQFKSLFFLFAFPQLKLILYRLLHCFPFIIFHKEILSLCQNFAIICAVLSLTSLP